jgi:uncharacterized protein YqhQ
MIAVISGIAMVLGFGLSFLLFVYLPTFLVDVVDKYLFKEALSNLHPLFEGILRMMIFVLYFYFVSLMPDIKRVFMYHGAEHKSIFCYEAGLELTVENVKKQSRFHPRCGTSFIFVTILLSILISSIVAVAFPALTEKTIIWVAVKLLMMPVIMGVGFEFIQLAGKYPNKFTKFLSAPGLLMQRITTAEPDDAIIEVAIEAMKACLSGEIPENTKTDAENDE